MKSNDKAHPSSAISEEAIQQLVRATREQGGALLVEGQVLDTASEPIHEEDLEPYPAEQPLPDELEWRNLLCHWARRAIRISRGEHPLCLQALDTLKAFCAGEASYRELAVARARLRGRANAAGAVGLRHGCADAAAALACFHACNPDLVEAIRQTKSFVRRTIEFTRATE